MKKEKKTCGGSLLLMMRKITGRHHSRTFERTMQAQSSTLNYLYINTNTIRNVSGLRYAIHLINLSVFCCHQITSESFVRGISECTNLRICSVLYNDLLGEEATAAMLFNCKELRKLMVSEPANLDNVFAQISQPLKLQKFVWQCSHPIVTSQVLRTIASLMPQLEHLYWGAARHSALTVPDFHLVITNCVKLKVLQIAGPHFFTDYSLLLMSQSLTSLRHITISARTEVSDAGVIALAQGCALLEFLDLSFVSQLTDVAIQAVGTHCQKLADLKVYNCVQLTDNAFRTLNVKSLRHLDVSGTQVNGTFTKHILRGASAITALMCKYCPNLHMHLLTLPPFNRLSSFSLSKLTFTQADWLSLSLRLPSLRNLTLRACVGIDGAALRSFVLYCSALRMLHVTDCYTPPDENAEFNLWLEAGAGKHIFLYLN